MPPAISTSVATGNRIATSIAPAICLGCVLAYAMHHRKSFEKLRDLLGRRFSSLLAMLLVAVLYAALVLRRQRDREAKWRSTR